MTQAQIEKYPVALDSPIGLNPRHFCIKLVNRFSPLTEKIYRYIRICIVKVSRHLYIEVFVHTHALSLAGLGVHVSSVSDSMNAIMLAQVELNQNSIHCFFFFLGLVRGDLPRP